MWNEKKRYEIPFFQSRRGAGGQRGKLPRVPWHRRGPVSPQSLLSLVTKVNNLIVIFKFNNFSQLCDDVSSTVDIIIIIIIKRKLKAQIKRKKRHKCAAVTQLPKTVDYSVGLMSMKQKCLQQFPKTEQ